MLSILFQLLVVLAVALCLLPKKVVLSIRNWVLKGFLKDSILGLLIAKLLGVVNNSATKMKDKEEENS